MIFGHDFAKFLVDNSAKVVASVFSLTWNFLTYKRFVFKSDIKHTPFNSIIKGWSDEKADIDNFLKLIVE